MKNQLSSISNIYCSGIVAKIPLLSRVQSTAFSYQAYVRDNPLERPQQNNVALRQDILGHFPPCVILTFAFDGNKAYMIHDACNHMPYFLNTEQLLYMNFLLPLSASTSNQVQARAAEWRSERLQYAGLNRPSQDNTQQLYTQLRFMVSNY